MYEDDITSFPNADFISENADELSESDQLSDLTPPAEGGLEITDFQLEGPVLTDESEPYVDENGRGGVPDEDVPDEDANIVKGLQDIVTSGEFRPTAMQIDVDIVFVIDCSGSMQPLLDGVKEKAKTFHEDVIAGLGKKQRVVNEMRIRVVAFRDFYYDWCAEKEKHKPLIMSDFFTVPDEQGALYDFLSSLEAAGGADEPECALEALHYAFNSEWKQNPNVPKRRQIIVLFTDASAHMLGAGYEPADRAKYVYYSKEHYPEGMPQTLSELQNEFNDPNVFPPSHDGTVLGHRLILFAPETLYPWDVVGQWESASCTTMDPAKGLKDINMDEVIGLIAGSIGNI